jgi:phytoene dehydrogenase-like protein
MRGWRCGSGTFRMNVALSDCRASPPCPATRRRSSHRGIILAQPGYMDRAYGDARTLGWSREPIIEMLIPSTLDDSLAPRGAHVASLFCQHVAPELPDGRSVERPSRPRGRSDDGHRRSLRPGFKASVIGRQALSPFDLEQCSV